MKKLALKLIRIYQNSFSFDHGPMRHRYPGGYCRFQPTCSQYTYEAIEKNGLMIGSLQGFWRIVRCNPWNKGGWDPVKKIKE